MCNHCFNGIFSSMIIVHIFCPLDYYYLHSKHHSYCVWITHKNNLERDVFLQISMKNYHDFSKI